MSKRKCSNYIASIWYLGGLYRHVKISHGVLYPKKNQCWSVHGTGLYMYCFKCVHLSVHILQDYPGSSCDFKNSKLLAESWFISCELLAGTGQLSNAFIASRAVDECPLPNAP